jgi:hypothetical protein
MTMSKEEHTKRLETVRQAKEKGVWDYEDEEFPREDWRNDVACGDTQLGYFDWVIHNLENIPVYDYYEEQLNSLLPINKEFGVAIQLRNEGNGKSTKWVTFNAECRAALKNFLQSLE